MKRACENFRIPYYSVTPTYSICPNHGYLTGENWKCPTCGSDCDVYSRVVGYFRPVRNWNAGKQEEFRQRKFFDRLER
jgi:ribonucleoside-triphosphate reductase